MKKKQTKRKNCVRPGRAASIRAAGFCICNYGCGCARRRSAARCHRSHIASNRIGSSSGGGSGKWCGGWRGMGAHVTRRVPAPPLALLRLLCKQGRPKKKLRRAARGRYWGGGATAAVITAIVAARRACRIMRAAARTALGDRPTVEELRTRGRSAACAEGPVACRRSARGSWCARSWPPACCSLRHQFNRCEARMLLC
eukprot:scaffold679_cov374-Prasinococcus_capsulatus_cf.AAC.11